MPPSSLVQQRCFHHGLREAVARCPECRRFFCRECIAEHGERMICAECLAKARPKPRHSSARWAGLAYCLLCLFGLFWGFLFFYGVGRFLLTVPAAYHDGTIWRKAWSDSQQP